MEHGYVGSNVISEPIMYTMHARKGVAMLESSEWNEIYTIAELNEYNACMATADMCEYC